MGNLPENEFFPEGVYQIETTDPVRGGPPNEETREGLANIPLLHLAKRTRWLKARVDELISTVKAIATKAEAEAATANDRTMTPLRTRQALTAAFSQSFAQTGWATLPNGLIVQWGRAQSSAAGVYSVVFPIPFPNAVFIVNVGDVTTAMDVAQSHVVSAGTPSLTGVDVLTVQNTTGVAETSLFTWIALGR